MSSPRERWRAAFAASSVFFISMAMVIGPTPPGTGVIHEARWMPGSSTTVV
ncbi:MAG: hypothetical protein WBV82_13020 [Myxococcaceae bacterium]